MHTFKSTCTSNERVCVCVCGYVWIISKGTTGISWFCFLMSLWIVALLHVNFTLERYCMWSQLETEDLKRCASTFWFCCLMRSIELSFRTSQRHICAVLHIMKKYEKQEDTPFNDVECPMKRAPLLRSHAMHLLQHRECQLLIFKYCSYPWNKVSRTNKSMVESSGSSYHLSSLPCNLPPRRWCLQAVPHLDQTSFLRPTPMDSRHAWSQWPSTCYHLQPCRTCCLHPGIWLSEYHWRDAVVEANPSWSHATTVAESCSLLASVAESKPKQIDINITGHNGTFKLQSNYILWVWHGCGTMMLDARIHQQSASTSLNCFPKESSTVPPWAYWSPWPRKQFSTVTVCQKFEYDDCSNASNSLNLKTISN